MHQWFVTYSAGSLASRKTFEVDAGSAPDAIALGDTLAATWLRLHGWEPGDLRGAPGTTAARLERCQMAPPPWMGIFGRRDGDLTRVTTAPLVEAILENKGKVPSPWNSTDDLPWRLDLRNHSPSGFEWGYMGSGPAQLALAICAYALGDERAESAYQDVKDQIVAGLPRQEWMIRVAWLREVAGEIEGKRAAELRGKDGAS